MLQSYPTDPSRNNRVGYLVIRLCALHIYIRFAIVVYARSDQGGWRRKTRRGSERKGVVGGRRKRKGALFGRGSGNVLIATSSNAYKKKLFSSPLRHPRFSFLLTFKIPPFFFRLPSPSSPSFLFLGLFKVET